MAEHAPVILLQQISVIAVIEARHHNMAALNQTHIGAGPVQMVQDIPHPGPGCVDQNPRR